jgi:hypothetical protein
MKLLPDEYEPSIWSVDRAVDEAMRLIAERKRIVDRLNTLAERWMWRGDHGPAHEVRVYQECQTELDEFIEELERGNRR